MDNWKNYQCWIENYPLEQSAFYHFTRTASQPEFFKAQLPFYKAVEVFPQFLCALASQISTPEVRSSLIENIWEEHGQGNAAHFHTESFQTYLRALSGLDTQALEESIEQISKERNYFFVQEWQDKVWAQLALNSPALGAAYLAGIEYIYTRVSTRITQTITNYPLFEAQTHYATHEVLDYHHARDLLELAYSLDTKTIETSMLATFSRGATDFMALLNQLSFLTQKDCETIAQDPVSFYYSREDYTVELNALAHIQSQSSTQTEPRILAVCSGGEHIIQLANTYPGAHIVALDINAEQLKLTQEKIAHLNATKDVLPLELGKGKFERLFAVIQQKLTLEDIQRIRSPERLGHKAACHKLKCVCAEVFSNQTLEIVFTPEATRYSEGCSTSFSEHFYQLLKRQIMGLSLEDLENKTPSNIQNVLGRTLPQVYPELTAQSIQNIEYVHLNFFDYFAQSTDKFELITLSNIGDWQPLPEFERLVAICASHLNPHGALVVRKLLGNYNLDTLLSDYRVYPVHDCTDFYSECRVAFLKEVL